MTEINVATWSKKTIQDTDKDTAAFLQLLRRRLNLHLSIPDDVNRSHRLTNTIIELLNTYELRDIVKLLCSNSFEKPQQQALTTFIIEIAGDISPKILERFKLLMDIANHEPTQSVLTALQNLRKRKLLDIKEQRK